MNILASYVVLEWKLLFRGRLMWFLMALVAGLFYLTTTNAYYAADIGRYAVSVSTFFIPMTILLAQLLTIHTARRERVNKVAHLMGTLPYHSWQWIAAKITALSIPFCAIALLPAIFYAYQAGRLGLAWSSMTNGIRMLASFIIPVLFAIVLSYAVGTWIRGGIVYLVNFALILTLLVLGRLALVFFLPIHWTHGIDIALSDLATFGYYSELWGFTDDVTYWLHRLFFALFAVFLCALLVYRAMRKRKERRGRWAFYLICGVALAAMVLCAYSYAAVWNERTNQYQQNIKFYSEVLRLENPRDINRMVIDQFLHDSVHGLEALGHDPRVDELAAQQPLRPYNPLTERHKQDLLLGQYYADLSATHYDLNVALEDNHGLSVTGTVRMFHGGDEAFERFPMSLRHIFEITLLKVNGQEAMFEWEPHQDVFWVIPAEPIEPHSVLELRIAYRGKVDDWRYRTAYTPRHNYWERRAFVDHDRLFLPGFYGWYPYPGNQRIAELDRRYVGSGTKSYETIYIVESEPDRSPADFHVKVEANNGMQIAANGEIVEKRSEGQRQIVTIQASGARGFSLLGGDITQRSIANDHAEINVALSNQIPAAYAAALIDKMLMSYEKLTNLASRLEPATYAPGKLYMVRADYPGMMDDGHIESKPIDHNGYLFLSRYTNPPAMLSGKSMLDFDHDVLRGTMFASGGFSHRNHLYVMMDTMSYYIHRDETTHGDEPLIQAGFRIWYDAMNKVYARYGAEGFPEALREIYQYLRTDKRQNRSFIEVDNDLVAFLEQLAGGARP